MLFKEGSIDESGYDSYYIVKLYDDDTLYFVYVDYEGNFVINYEPYTSSDVRYHALAVLTNQI